MRHVERTLRPIAAYGHPETQQSPDPRQHHDPHECSPSAALATVGRLMRGPSLLGHPSSLVCGLPDTSGRASRAAGRTPPAATAINLGHTPWFATESDHASIEAPCLP